jgi:hypothetical protein
LSSRESGITFRILTSILFKFICYVFIRFFHHSFQKFLSFCQEETQLFSILQSHGIHRIHSIENYIWHQLETSNSLNKLLDCSNAYNNLINCWLFSSHYCLF